MSQQLLLRVPKQQLSWDTLFHWPLSPALLNTVQLHHAVDHQETYVRVFAEDVTPLVPLLQQACPSARLDVLTLTQSIANPVENQSAAWFYLVETDIDPEVEADFNRWYSEEHLPGLAAVNGTLRAERWYSEDSSPHYLASYELASLDTFGSPAWLAVRATPWSGRIRPYFFNTKRTMFTTVPRPERC